LRDYSVKFVGKEKKIRKKREKELGRMMEVGELV
jgi:hypothetical protein